MSQTSPETARATFESFIDLEPHEWLYAYWRRTGPLPAPEVVPFDLARVTKELSKVRVIGLSHQNYKLEFVSNPLTWSREESLFWIQSISQKEAIKKEIDKRRSEAYKATGTNEGFDEVSINAMLDREMALHLQDRDFTLDPGLGPLEALIEQTFVQDHDGRIWAPYMVLAALSNICDLPRFIEFWEHKITCYYGFGVLECLRKYKLPYLSDCELEQTKDYLRSQIKEQAWLPSQGDSEIPLSLIVASALSMQEELLPVIEKLSQESFPKHYNTIFKRPQVLVLGLREVALIKQHFARLNLCLEGKSDCVSWLAQTKLSELVQFVFACLYKVYPHSVDRETRDLVLYGLSLVHGPELAYPIFILGFNGAFTDFSKEWIKSNPVLAFVGLSRTMIFDALWRIKVDRLLLQLCTHIEADDLPEDVRPHLISMRQHKSLRRHSKKTLTTADAGCPDWLKSLFATNVFKRLSMPLWLTSERIGSLTIDGYTLTDIEMHQVFAAIKSSKPTNIHPFLLDLRDSVPRQSFDQFVWRLFEQWLEFDADSKDKWCIYAIGYLASSETVIKLTPLMKAWRKSGNSARAAFGLDCMRACGTDRALLQILAITRTAGIKSLRHKAVKVFQEIAQERGLTVEQLQDRIVPDCGMDVNGERVFEFGTRRFVGFVGKDHTASLKDEHGNIKSALPPAKQTDKPHLVAKARAEWKAFKSEVAQVVQEQSIRLEKLMVQGRRWTTAEYTDILLAHPLLRCLCQSLIWGQFDAAGNLIHSFRLTDEGDFADPSDKPVSLIAAYDLGLIHPLALNEIQLAQWREALTDYHIVSPFAQIDRPVYTLSQKELDTASISRFEGLLVAPMALFLALKHKDWIREDTNDDAVFKGQYKYFAHGDITASITYPGIIAGKISASEKQLISDIAFYSGSVTVSSWHNVGACIRADLSKVPKSVISEVIGDLNVAMRSADMG